jgi:hypothetical protein
MALTRNGSHQLSGLSRVIGVTGAYGLRSALENNGQKKNFDSGQHAVSNVTNRNACPNGARHPVAWKQPTKAGGLASANEATASFTFTATGNYGRNIASQIDVAITVNQAALGLIVGGVASIPFSVIVNQAALGGTQNMAAGLVGPTFVINSNISAESGLATSATFSFTLNGSTLKATGSLAAEISGATEAITPATVAAEVWNSVSAVFNTAGSMGAKLNSAASAGDPWTTTLPGSYLPGTAGAIIGTLENDINLHTDGAIATLNLQELKFAIESLRPHHTGYGTAFYWNPVSGDDGADGLTPQTACKTFAHIHNNLVTDYGHDIVYCLPESAGTGITTAEGITISKNYVFVRGPGRDFEIDTSISGGAGVIITGKGVELHGVRVKTDSASSADAITISGDFAYIDQVWIESCGGDAISITTSSNTIINGGYFRAYKGHGINVGNSVNHLWLNNVGLHGSSAGSGGTGSGVYINGTSVFEVKLIGRCDIHQHVRYGVEVVQSGTRTSISPDTLFENNTLGDTYDTANRIVFDGRVTIEKETAPALLTAAAAAPIAANVKEVNDIAITGLGTEATPWGPV